MDIEKLIERLRTESLYADKASLEIMDLCMEAATALSTLQAENEKLRAELEQVKAERDAAIKDIWVPKWISCKNAENCSFVSAITGMPDCAGCDNWEWRGQKKD